MEVGGGKKPRKKSVGVQNKVGNFDSREKEKKEKLEIHECGKLEMGL